MEKLLYTIPETCKVIGVGRTTVYELIENRKLEAVKVGARRLVVADSTRRYVESLRAAAA